MIQKLIPVGDGLGLVLDRALLERLRIDQDTPLEVSVEDGALVVRAAQEAHRERVERSVRRMMDAHAETLQRLAL